MSRNLQSHESGLLRPGKAGPYEPVDIFIDEYLTVSTTEMGGGFEHS